MRHDLSSLERALRAATDRHGVLRVLERLGYARLDGGPGSSPVGGGSDGGSRADGAGMPEAAAPGGRPLAAGGGILVVLRIEGGAGNGGRPDADRVRAALGRVPGRPRLLVLADPGFERITFGSTGLDGRARWITVRRGEPRRSEVEAVAELEVRPGDAATTTLLRTQRALDRSALTRRFFRDFRVQRDAIAAAWRGLPADAQEDREQLALLLLSRLMFLYFLQRDGILAGERDFMARLARRWAAGGGSGGPGRAPGGGATRATFFRAVLQPLFFAALNTRPDRRPHAALRLGALPYLNGGLFERHPLERRYAELDLPDAASLGSFDALLERYRFGHEMPSEEGTNLGVDPEMLGRVFENLMAADRRGRTGTFFTPARVVDGLVLRSLQGYLAGQPGMDWRAAGLLVRESASETGYATRRRASEAVRRGADTDAAVREAGRRALPALREVRVLDPACGSGAFLLGSLQALVRLRCRLGDGEDAAGVRRELVARGLHGVDLQADAALLCALRLWLALSVARDDGVVEPLPNLDRQVRQGDALLDPLDLAASGDAGAIVWRAAALDARVRRARRALHALGRRYVHVGPETRRQLSRRLARAERRLARRWLAAALERVEQERRATVARAGTPDLFGGAHRQAGDERLAQLDRMRAELDRLAELLAEAGALPFFSFDLHFPATDGRGFQLVLSNPPWVRSHRWPASLTRLIRSRFEVCGAPAGGGRRRGGGQVDMAALFLERGLTLLEERGVLGMLVPSKTMRSMAGAGARSLLMRCARLLLLQDYGLDHRALFRADTFAASVVARKLTPGGSDGPTPATACVRVALHRRSGRPLRFSTSLEQLPLDATDPRSPWVIAPPAVRRALRSMQAAAPSLSKREDLRIRRGVMTGANDVFVFEAAEPKLGDLARVQSRESGRVLVEIESLCPLVRGTDIRAFTVQPSAFLAWCHDDQTGAPRPPRPLMARYLARHVRRLRARAGWRPGLPDGAIFRLDRAALGHRVAWRDLARRLEAAWLPPRLTAGLGTPRPLLALNTVYYIGGDRTSCMLLSALLNALPARVFTRTIAERAKDAHFRFFAWTVGALPLPRLSPADEDGRALLRLAESAHEAGGVSPEAARELDERACRLYALDRPARRALRAFDLWLDEAARPAAQEEP